MAPPRHRHGPAAKEPSSYTEDAYRLMVSDSGADVFVSKQVIMTSLLPAIRDLVRRWLWRERPGPADHGCIIVRAAPNVMTSGTNFDNHALAALHPARGVTEAQLNEVLWGTALPNHVHSKRGTDLAKNVIRSGKENAGTAGLAPHVLVASAHLGPVVVSRIELPSVDEQLAVEEIQFLDSGVGVRRVRCTRR